MGRRTKPKGGRSGNPRKERLERAQRRRDAKLKRSFLGLKRSIHEDVASVRSLIRDNDAVAVASALAMSVVFQLEAEPERMADTLAALEYALGLIVAEGQIRDTHDQLSDEHSPIDDIRAHLDRIFENLLFYAMAASGGEATEDRSRARFVSTMQHVFWRGEGTMAHITEYAAEYYGVHDDWFKRALGGTGEAFLRQMLSLLELVEKQANDVMESMRVVHEKWEEWRARGAPMPGDGWTPDDSMKDALTHAMATNPFDVTDGAGFLRRGDGSYRLTLALGENQELIGEGDNAAWPLNYNRIRANGFVSVGDRLYCWSPQTVAYGLLDSLEELIATEDPGYYHRSFHKRRDAHTERRVLDIVNGALGDRADVYGPVYYDVQGESGLLRVESDLLVFLGRVAIVLEVKAGGFSEPAKRGGVARIETHLKALIGKASDQAARLCLRLLSGEEVRMFNRGGKEVRTIEAGYVIDAFSIAVTQRALGFFGASHHEYASLSRLNPDVPTTAINLFDLRVVLDVLDRREEFVLYLRRRRAFVGDGRGTSMDEVDLLGMFLRQGLYLGEDEFDGFDRVSVGTFDDEIWNWYEKAESGVDEGKPSLALPGGWRVLANGVAGQNHPGSVWAAALLLEFGSDAIEEFEAKIGELHALRESDGRSHRLTIVPESHDALIMLIVPGEYSPGQPHTQG